MRNRQLMQLYVQADFDAATALAGKIATASGITNDEKLEMYSLFKQASEGDCATGEL